VTKAGAIPDVAQVADYFGSLPDYLGHNGQT
jgi:hypothetical protein